MVRIPMSGHGDVNRTKNVLETSRNSAESVVDVNEVSQAEEGESAEALLRNSLQLTRPSFL